MHAALIEYQASCHCGALEARYRTAVPVAAWSVRACQCAFCRAREALTTSDPAGTLTFAAREIGLATRFFQTNHEGAFVEHLHGLDGRADGILLNPGAWTHYSYAIRDALELTGLPAVEVHLSDVASREPFRRESVIRELCFATVAGKGHEGYREALQRLREELAA